MAFARTDTGVATFSNPIDTESDDDRIYSINLQGSPRQIEVWGQRDDGQPGVKLWEKDVHGETQNAAICIHKGEVVVTALILDTDGSRMQEHFHTGIRTAGATPTPTPTGADNSTIIAQLIAHADHVDAAHNEWMDHFRTLIGQLR